MAPIGASRVSSRQAYAQVEETALRHGRPSAHTAVILHRYGLDGLESRADRLVERLHQKAVETGERDLLFALAEMSYIAGDQIRRSVKPWDARDARDYYLGSAVYAWLFLFGESDQPRPGMFDRRFRDACDLYNFSLGLALTSGRSTTNDTVVLSGGRRRLPVGEMDISFPQDNPAIQTSDFERILLADQFRVNGMSVRNREPGMGAPLIAVKGLNPQFNIRPSVPVTAFLRCQTSLESLTNSPASATLELYDSYENALVSVAGLDVPIETDLTAYRAYTLSQSRIWKLGNLGFLAPAERIPSQLIPNQPFKPNRIPLVLVHGTFSSPVTWAEMANTLLSDQVLRERYQMWSFVYGSGNPLIISVADLRTALTNEVQRLDPAGTNSFLRQMVVIGHSQGGLLTKGAAIHTEDQLWRSISTNRFEDVTLTDSERASLRDLLFFDPLPFVSRVVFIATPHRGSYLATGIARKLARKLVALPSAVADRGKNLMKMTAGSEAEQFLRGRMPTSLDGMSPENPGLLAMSDIPVAQEIKAHSIIPVKSEGGLHNGRDGVVAYSSAHLECVQSELVVRSGHSCLDHPATIEEVRRILHEHLREANLP